MIRVSREPVGPGIAALRAVRNVSQHASDVGMASHTFHTVWPPTEYTDRDTVKFLNVYFPWSAGNQKHLLLASTMTVVRGSEQSTGIKLPCLLLMGSWVTCVRLDGLDRGQTAVSLQKDEISAPENLIGITSHRCAP